MLELARECDWTDFHRLSLQIHEMHVAWRPDIYCHTDCPVPMDSFLKLIEDKSLFLAHLDELIVGYVQFCIWTSSGPGNVVRKALRLDSICVDEKFRHRGIGSQMMQELTVIARAFGCTEILLSVQPENEAAMAMYTKLGFGIRNISLLKKV